MLSEPAELAFDEIPTAVVVHIAGVIVSMTYSLRRAMSTRRRSAQAPRRLGTVRITVPRLHTDTRIDGGMACCVIV